MGHSTPHRAPLLLGVRNSASVHFCNVLRLDGGKQWLNAVKEWRRGPGHPQSRPPLTMRLIRWSFVKTHAASDTVFWASVAAVLLAQLAFAWEVDRFHLSPVHL